LGFPPIVVILYYGSTVVISLYLSSKYSHGWDILISEFYMLVIPMLYLRMRNRDVKETLGKPLTKAPEFLSLFLPTWHYVHSSIGRKGKEREPLLSPSMSQSLL
jgi:hypothetical protein